MSAAAVTAVTATVYDLTIAHECQGGLACPIHNCLSLFLWPAQVFGLQWNPHELTHAIEPQFATFGKKHLKLWRAAAPGGAWAATQLSFGKLPLQNVVSAAFLLPCGPLKQCTLAAGMADGQVYLFKVRAELLRSLRFSLRNMHVQHHAERSGSCERVLVAAAWCVAPCCTATRTTQWIEVHRCKRAVTVIPAAGHLPYSCHSRPQARAQVDSA